MKKTLIVILVLVMALSLCACGGHKCESPCEKCGKCLDETCAHESCTEKCDCHRCESVCLECGKCYDATCAEEVCAEKCAGHRDDAVVFPSGDYITQEDIEIELDSMVFKIGKGIYVRGDFEKMAKNIIATIEKTAGYSFGNKTHNENKDIVDVSRDHLYADLDWYTGSKISEVGKAFATFGEAQLSPGDLFTTSGYAFIHELGHVLMFREEYYANSQLLDEGFAEYTTYLVVKELQKNYPEYMMHIIFPGEILSNMRIDNYDELYKYPIEHWFENEYENGFKYSGNGNYSIGFRFMAYLDAVYGSYSKWVSVADDMYPTDQVDLMTLPCEKQYAILKAAYGENVLEGFYPWLKENQAQFETEEIYEGDLTDAKQVNWYPTFDAVSSNVLLMHLKYNDLYLNIETVRKYLSEYKGADISDLKLESFGDCPVRLYKADGSYYLANARSPLSLEGISYIKLVGDGSFEGMEKPDFFRLEITGFELP